MFLWQSLRVKGLEWSGVVEGGGTRWVGDVQGAEHLCCAEVRETGGAPVHAAVSACCFHRLRLATG